MPKYIRHILIELCGMVGSAVLMSCADRMPEMPGASDPTEGYFFVLDTGDGRGTRASVTSDWSTLADEGDIVGAFNLGNASDPENVRYSVRNVADRQVLVPAVEGTELTKQTTDYLFYYPYDPEMTMEKARDLKHSVMVDQQQDGAFESSDLLWDVAHASDSKCLVALDHAMASVTVIAQAEGNDFFNNVKILGQPLSASGIDLTADGPDALNYDTDEGASDITALYAPYSTDADHYRAVVPANRTIPSGTRIISHYSRDGVHEYTLRRDLELQPGRNYVFTLLRSNSPSPDVTDDDSWVLDVLDPQTGQPVGLLCREYLRWNQTDTKWDGFDDPTYPGGPDGPMRVNSQAWVFYNLQSDGRTPDLSEGTVLRFVYDVRKNTFRGIADDEDGYAWPKPHNYAGHGADKHFGMFLADHGHTWKSYGTYGASSETWTEYYMHGSRITWDGIENMLSSFTLPDGLRITNQTARKQGHVAIPTDGSSPYVSYDPYSGATDASGNRVGYTLPHCLVDKRINSEGKMERRAYPLVKIGFNQFWMSKSFRGKTLTDGTPLRCYNIKNQPGTVSLHPDLYPRWEMPVPVSGYVYPMLPQIVMGSYSGADAMADPYSEYHDGLQYPDHVLEMPLLYNYRALLEPGLVPESDESIASYRIPTMTDYTYLHHYLGKQSTVKLMSNQIQTRDDNGPLESPHDAFMKGKYLFFHDLNMYPGNVSGFNLKSHGRIFGYNGLASEGDGNFFIYPGNIDGSFSISEYMKGMTVVSHHAWNCWDQGNDGSIFKHGFVDHKPYNYPIGKNGDHTWDKDNPDRFSQNAVMRFATFAQVRFFLEFKNQKYVTGSGPDTRRQAIRLPSQSRIVYVPVDM